MSNMKYTALVILWILWCSVHSGMISLTVTRYIKIKFGRHFKFYRLFYNLAAITTIAPLIIYTLGFNEAVIYRWEGYMIFVRFFLIAASIILFIAGSLKYDLLQFSGIRQIKSGKSYSTLSESGEIDSSGILGFIRHPWYLASIIFIWVCQREICISTLIVNVLLTVYLIIGTFLEERKLIIEFGDSYRDYMHRVSRLFPVKWFFSFFR